MHVTLVHNPTAGDGSPGSDELSALLRAAGHDPHCVSSKKKKDLKRALEEAKDLVLVAGGDGTVEKVARRLEGSSVPMAILPFGTSNNIASSLGVTGSAADIIAGLNETTPSRLDLGIARAPWGEKTFVESAGVGAFADMLRNAMRAEASSGRIAVGRGTKFRGQGFRKALVAARAKRRTLEVDGEDRSGDYLLVIALNTRYAGANVDLAPRADPGDGKLEIVLVREEDRAAVDDFLAGLPSGRVDPFPLPAFPARRIRLEWDVASGHLDDELWPDEFPTGFAETPRPMVELGVVDSPLQVLVVARRP